MGIKSDALELLKEAIANGCNATLMVVTGNGNHGDGVEAMEVGQWTYSPKGRSTQPS